VWSKKHVDNRWKADNSRKSIVFRLKNPNNLPAKRFALKAEEKHHAIYCNPERGPRFRDIGVSDLP
jgi:hypothetical protein